MSGCFYCARPVYAAGVCFSHWLRFLRTTYGEKAVLAAVRENAATADTATA